MEVDHGFDAAANMILDVVERDFGITPRNGRPMTHRAIVRIMEHFGIEKTEKQIVAAIAGRARSAPIGASSERRRRCEAGNGRQRRRGRGGASMTAFLDRMFPDHHPPLWMRHITPWWLLRVIDSHTGLCWAAMVMWKTNGSDWSWIPSRCLEPYDYCGKFKR